MILRIRDLILPPVGLTLCTLAQMMMRTFHFTLRSLRRSPLFTIAVLGILAIGLGATTAITSIVDTVLLRPLPFNEPGRLVVIWGSRPQVDLANYLVSPADFFDWRERSEVFAGLSAYTESFFNLDAGSGADWPERIAGMVATPDLLDTLGVNPAMGRALAAEDAFNGATKAVVVSHGFWQRRLGSTPLGVDTTVTLDSAVATVVGVLPPDFLFFGKSFEVIAVYAPSPQGLANREAHFLTVVGRLAPTVSIDRAQEAMDQLSAQLAKDWPGTNSGKGARIVTLRDELVGEVDTALCLLLLAVACVLAMTCTNVANLLLARGIARRQELAVRASLGATCSRLVRQLLGEGLVLGVLGGLGGLLIAWLGIEALRALAPVEVPRFDRVELGWRFFGFASLLSALTGLGVALLPAVGSTRIELATTLAAAGRSPGKLPAGRRLRTALVTAEVTLAVVLLISAGLLLRSFSHLLGESHGFTTRDRVALDLSVPSSRLAEGDDPGAFLHRLLEQARLDPRIEAIGATSHLPMSGEEGSRSFTIAGQEHLDPDGERAAQYRRISVGYSEVMDIPLIRGRTFTAADTGLPRTAMINRAFAERHFPGENAVGRHLFIRDGAGDEQREIVGVLGDIRHFSLDQRPQPELYVPMLQRPWPSMSLVVASTSGLEATAHAVNEALRAMDPGLPVANVRRLGDSVVRSAATQRFSAILVTLFAAIAALLATAGIYGVQATLIQQLYKEIGIRLALGAGPWDVLKLVLVRGALPATIGLAVGLGLAAGVAGLLESQLYQVSAWDATTFVTVPLGLALAALLACYLPARQALELDPGRLFSE